LVGSGIIAYRDDPEKAATLLGRAVAVQPTDLRLLLLAAALQKTGRTVDAQVARDRAQKNSADLARAQSAANHLLGIQPGISN
jgi:Flp pilus assembly protein TadD